MTLFARLRALLGRSGPDIRHRSIVLRQRDALAKALRILPDDPVLVAEARRVEREYERLERSVEDARL